MRPFFSMVTLCTGRWMTVFVYATGYDPRKYSTTWTSGWRRWANLSQPISRGLIYEFVIFSNRIYARNNLNRSSRSLSGLSSRWFDLLDGSHPLGYKLFPHSSVSVGSDEKAFHSIVSSPLSIRLHNDNLAGGCRQFCRGGRFVVVHSATRR